MLLVQHLFHDNNNPSAQFGRLYFDDILIPVRSESESLIIKFLQTAAIDTNDGREEKGNQISKNALVIGEETKQVYDAIQEGPEAALREMVSLVVSWVLPDEYVALEINDGRPVA